MRTPPRYPPGFRPPPFSRQSVIVGVPGSAYSPPAGAGLGDFWSDAGKTISQAGQAVTSAVSNAASSASSTITGAINQAGKIAQQAGQAAGQAAQTVAQDASKAGSQVTQAVDNTITAVVNPTSPYDKIVPGWSGVRGWLPDAIRKTIEKIFDDALSVDTFLQNDLISVLKAGGTNGQAILALGTWINQIAIDFLPAILLTSSGAQRTAAANQIDPLSKTSDVYKLITAKRKSEGGTGDTENLANAFDLLCAISFAPMAVALSSVTRTPGPMVALAGHPNGYSRWIKDALNIMVTVPPGNPRTKALIGLAQDFVELVVGVRVGPAAGLEIATLILTNLPQPPYTKIVETLLGDPVAQKNLTSKGIPVVITSRILPVAVGCLQADNAEAWLKCAEGLVDVIFPRLISDLRDKFGVDPNSLRIIVSAVWRTGGDLSVLLDEGKFPGIQDALVGAGFMAIRHVANAIGYADPRTFIDKVLGPLIKQTVPALFDKLITAADFSVLLFACFDENAARQLSQAAGLAGVDGLGAGLGADTTTGPKNPLPQPVQLAINELAKAHWDVEQACINMLVTEVVLPAEQRVQVSVISLMRTIPTDVTSPFKPPALLLLALVAQKFPRVREMLVRLGILTPAQLVALGAPPLGALFGGRIAAAGATSTPPQTIVATARNNQTLTTGQGITVNVPVPPGFNVPLGVAGAAVGYFLPLLGGPLVALAVGGAAGAGLFNAFLPAPLLNATR